MKSAAALPGRSIRFPPIWLRESDPLSGIRAVLFDVYGTLLISASGDISLASEASRGDAAQAAFLALQVELGCPGDEVVERLHQAIQRRHQATGTKHAEVEIREIWTEVLRELAERRAIGSDESIDVERLAIEYEMRANPVWPMPTARETLASLKSSGVMLGIISNAQFFTPLLFPALLGQSLGDLGFDESLQIWSFEHRRAKPGRRLYELAVSALQARGVAPAETLYVGNDMRNDVAPAQSLGLATALFAGDRRSLRLREDDPSAAAATPDRIVTELRQIPQMLQHR